MIQPFIERQLCGALSCVYMAQLGVAAGTCYLSSQQVEVGGSGVQGHLGLLETLKTAE